MPEFTPTREDKFSFGLWTVGWQGVDVFGTAVRPAGPCRRGTKLAELGAWGVTFHDNDVFPSGRAPPTRSGTRRSGGPGGHRADRPHDHHQPVLAPGVPRRRAHQQRPRRAPLRHPQGRRQPRPGRVPGRGHVRVLGGREAESGAAKDVRAALDRYKEAFDVLGAYVLDQGYSIRFALEPKPNEPRGDILLPTVGHALAFINELAHPELVGLNPEVGHEEMASLNFAHGLAQALWHGKLFHVDLNGQHGPATTRTCALGPGTPGGVLDGRHPGGRRLPGPRHFDFKPPRTEDRDGCGPRRPPACATTSS